LNTKKKIRPIIKWTGGKFDEFQEFAPYIPKFENYYEPFFGGGGVFFALQPQGKSFINDRSTDLVAFYRQIALPEFKAELMRYVQAWEQAGRLSSNLISFLEKSFKKFVDGKVDNAALQTKVSDFFSTQLLVQHKTLFDVAVVMNVEGFRLALIHSLIDKAKRIRRISEKENRKFELSELGDHIETGVKSGLYLHLRKMMNQQAMGSGSLSAAQKSAIWYFVREFCYASMFRFNAKGEFNIPYGGIAYNKKNFRQKVEYIFAEQTQQLFKKAQVANEDFDVFLKQSKPRKNDFVFLDPPYDSEFSEYDQNAFTAKDQERLRDVILQLKAKCMVVIKETPLIRKLYANPPFHVLNFNKTYTYNVRGRNNRDTQHLIILNYSPNQ